MLSKTVLRHQGFRDLFIGQGVSQLGDALYYVVFMFMVGKITGSAAWVGFVGAVEMLPYVFFSGYAGVLADRIDRKKILLYTDWICMGILLAFGAVIFATGTPPVWTIFLTAGLLSVFRAFFYPAKNAAIPNLVPADEVLQANTLNAMSFNGFFTLGLLVSTFVLSSLYALSPSFFFGLTVILNAFSFGVSALFIRRIPSVIPERKDEVQHPWTEFKEGIAYIRRRRALTVLMVAALFMSLAISPFMVVYVDANNQWFGGKPFTLTLCELSFFLAMMLGSIAVAKIKVKLVGIGYAVGLGVTGLAVACMAGSPILWLFCLLNFACGLFVPFADIPVQSYVQLKVEDAFRGRVNSALSMLRTGMTPLGLSLGGLMIDVVGLIPMFLTMGIGMFVVAGLALTDRAFRNATLDHEEGDPGPPNGTAADLCPEPA
ncbi:MAG TPA: MFS transporter [Fimbriimonadaceae bacterium]|nr:MFS transporter [Fimbriimonadaceae bacterium]